jgi:hypothetical protein
VPVSDTESCNQLMIKCKRQNAGLDSKSEVSCRGMARAAQENILEIEALCNSLLVGCIHPPIRGCGTHLVCNSR